MANPCVSRRAPAQRAGGDGVLLDDHGIVAPSVDMAGNASHQRIAFDLRLWNWCADHQSDDADQPAQTEYDCGQ